MEAALSSSTPSPVRQLSVRSIMEAFLRGGAISRAELARRTGLSKQTASEVVRALTDQGLVRTHGQTRGVLGRSAVTYTLDSRAAFVAGIDLGGTKLRLALADLAGNLVGEDVEPTDPRGGLHVVEQVAGLARRIAAGAGVPTGALRGATLGSPGVLDPRTGSIGIAPNIPGFDRLDVRGALGTALGCGVAMENDVNLAARGEHFQGCCTDARDFVFIALGTGVGMGIFSDGRLVRGAGGAAGEIAYLPLGGDPYDARGYRLGTLETALGSAGLLARYNMASPTPAADMRVVFDRAAQGDMAAATMLDEAARLLLVALQAVRSVLDPERVVLGGSIGVRPELVERVRLMAARHMPQPFPPVRASALGSRATVVGAVGDALSRLHAGMFGLREMPAEAQSGVEAAA
jgi:predicted NBD/HSP70 family sugar kinase